MRGSRHTDRSVDWTDVHGGDQRGESAASSPRGVPSMSGVDLTLGRGLATCCGKPVGCTMTHDGCAYLRHPWKRAMVYGDTSAPCQSEAIQRGRRVQCVLLHGHE